MPKKENKNRSTGTDGFAGQMPGIAGEEQAEYITRLQEQLEFEEEDPSTGSAKPVTEEEFSKNMDEWIAGSSSSGQPPE